MKTSNASKFKPLVGKIMMGLLLAAMIGSIDVAPALGKDDHGRGGGHDKGRYEQRGRGPDRGHYVYERGRRVYRPYYYGYSEPVYVPPPVIYAPPPAPGISIWLPPIVIPLR